jgi:hypothetical protein
MIAFPSCALNLLEHLVTLIAMTENVSGGTKTWYFKICVRNYEFNFVIWLYQICVMFSILMEVTHDISNFQTISGAHPTSYSESLSLEVNWLVHHVYHSPPSIVEAEYSWTCTSTSPCFQEVMAIEAQFPFLKKTFLINKVW